ncbi:beta-N-acetylhexosaminidase [Planomonospora sp. ID67723]|uniref:beta-N-acetylhexosaminidase n=1 Tax=Planomonospora sp. ID67723 TaxID=2738134 RepID=UPI0018C434C0|nr:beta-N-acetylhexosaminidase [Planomonospora sp. ID67723]MBG0826551.1 beta-N-acetylhexosaminidase [Planomonospora sp. ID67723]
MNDLLPRPLSAVSTGPGSLALSPGDTISGPAGLVEAVRRALAALDLRPAASGTVQVEADASLGAEAYRLEVSAEGVRIAAADRSGAFYAGQTLRQLLPDAAFRSVPAGGSVPLVRVEDAPRFSWRGVHLDVARHFLPKREVLRMIDLMAAHKLNRLHLHLVDDQGWRFESRAYPRLHEVASHRPQTITTYYKEEPAYDGVPHGGYYTLDDLAEIAAYGRARAVTIVPEIDVPGHASAVLAAYPEFDARATGGRTPEPFPVLERWGISPAILSPLPPTVGFLTVVIDELLGALGEAPYVHVGGDECVLDDWAASPEITAFQAELGLSSLPEVHAWFLRRLADVLAERGSRAVVWDEAFVSGMLRPDTIVMPWRGMDVARRAAGAGHDVVQTPIFPLYFDYAEASSAEEPVAIGDAITLADVAGFEPVPGAWTEEERGHVLGAQFQLWSERLPDGRAVDYRAWPRGCALAEVAWSGSADASFAVRLERHLRRLDALGVEYRPLDGPRPWQRGGTGWRRHRPGVVRVDEAMKHVEELALTADSTRPSL